MSLTPKRQKKKEKATSGACELLISLGRVLVSIFHKYLHFRIWVLLIPLVIVTLMGKLFSRDGMLVGLVIIIYILLSWLDRWFEKHEEK